MSSQGVYFLSFLEDIIPEAAQKAKEMEDLLFEDSSSAVVKARVFAEAILNEVFKMEKIDNPYISTFFDKISYLSREEIIEREIQQAFDTIRMAGNKAAHDVSFNDITVAFRLHKEMYKIGVWFFEVYTSVQSKVPPYETPKPTKKENLEEIVKKQIMELLGAGQFDNINKDSENREEFVSAGEENAIEVNTDENQEAQVNLLIKDLGPNESYLIRELSRLKDSAQEAIENANQFSDFKEYLHVDRKIQRDLENILQSNKGRERGNLILLCGSVGDGKSHLLAYLKEKRPDLISQYIVFNDATESFSPSKNAMETLEEILRNFSDQNIEKCNQKIILAINMGVLHNFINTKHKEYTYKTLEGFIDQSELFSQNITTHFSKDYFDLLSFGDYHSYELTENGAKSNFYTSLLKKVFEPSHHNPFYLAFLEDEKNNYHTMVHDNYKLLQNIFVQDQIVQLVIQTVIKKKLVISARAFLNFIADILIPDDLRRKQLMNDFDVLEFSLPNLLFNRKDRSTILNALSQLDPIHTRSVSIDQLIVELNTLNDLNSVITKYIKDETPKGWFDKFSSKNDFIIDHSFNLFFESFIRITYLTNEQFAISISNKSYSNFLRYLYYFNSGDKKKIKGFYEELKKAIVKWKGSPKKDYIYLDKPSKNYGLAQKLNLRPSIDHLIISTKDELESFKSSIILAYHGGDLENKIFLDIDFPLYSLLMKVREGYRPNKKDEEDAIRFVEFIEKVMSFGEKKKEILVHFPKDNKCYAIKRDDFGSFVFERE